MYSRRTVIGQSSKPFILLIFSSYCSVTISIQVINDLIKAEEFLMVGVN